MKKIILALLLTAFGIHSFAKSISEDKVPVIVKYAFYQNYSQANHVKWELTKMRDYKASFRINDEYGSAYFNEKGEFIESDISVEWQNVPFIGRMEIYHLSFSGHITGVLKIINSKNEVFYQVELKRGLKYYEIFLDKEGNLLI